MIEGKIIRCCGECIHYNLKKHRCTLGHNKDNPTHHFYDDCTTLEDLAEHDAKIRADAIDEAFELLVDEIIETEHSIETEDGDDCGLTIDEMCDCIERVEEKLMTKGAEKREYQRGRADAIKECIEVLKGIDTYVADVVEKQLKEQKNEV